MLAAPGPGAIAAETVPPAVLDGRYAIGDPATGVVIVRRLGEDMYSVSSPGLWNGVAFLDGSEWWGAFQYPEVSSDRSLARSGGTWRGTIDANATWLVHGEFIHGSRGKFDQTWILRRPASPDSLPERARPMVGATPGAGARPVPPTAGAAGDSTLPRPGERVQVEELPVALTKVAPSYPEEARHKGISGTVMVEALIGRNGKVVDALVTGSVPGLDEAALECVRQWEFVPAKNAGKPVAVWVAIPIKFTLH